MPHTAEREEQGRAMIDETTTRRLAPAVSWFDEEAEKSFPGFKAIELCPRTAKQPA